jgi:hypothetical protein
MLGKHLQVLKKHFSVCTDDALSEFVHYGNIGKKHLRRERIKAAVPFRK